MTCHKLTGSIVIIFAKGKETVFSLGEEKCTMITPIECEEIGVKFLLAFALLNHSWQMFATCGIFQACSWGVLFCFCFGLFSFKDENL